MDSAWSRGHRLALRKLRQRDVDVVLYRLRQEIHHIKYKAEKVKNGTAETRRQTGLQAPNAHEFKIANSKRKQWERWERMTDEKKKKYVYNGQDRYDLLPKKTKMQRESKLITEISKLALGDVGLDIIEEIEHELVTGGVNIVPPVRQNTS